MRDAAIGSQEQIGRIGAGAAVRGRRPAVAVRLESRPGGRAERVGLLPRPGRVGRRHDRPDRGAGRALRTGLPRPDPRPRDPWTGRHGGLRRELHRWRHQRRHPGHPPAVLPAMADRRPVPGRAGPVFVFVVDAAAPGADALGEPAGIGPELVAMLAGAAVFAVAAMALQPKDEPPTFQGPSGTTVPVPPPASKVRLSMIELSHRRAFRRRGSSLAAGAPKCHPADARRT